jgi:hypothetical protein
MDEECCWLGQLVGAAAAMCPDCIATYMESLCCLEYILNAYGWLDVVGLLLCGMRRWLFVVRV